MKVEMDIFLVTGMVETRPQYGGYETHVIGVFDCSIKATEAAVTFESQNQMFRTKTTIETIAMNVEALR